jgi:ribosomal protein S18 acetylase RimI-like enzyme
MKLIFIYKNILYILSNMIIRNTTLVDIDEICELQSSCFESGDTWSRYTYLKYINNSLVIEIDNKIVSVLIQGHITPSGYGKIFEPVNEIGQKFLDDKKNKQSTFGIALIFTDNNFRKKGFGEILINKHFELNKNRTVCLNTRVSNTNSISLYKKVGYNHIANIKNYYNYPSEDSVFMIKETI